MSRMGWLRFVGSLKLYVSFAKEPYKRDVYSAKETYNFKEPTNCSHPILRMCSSHFCLAIGKFHIFHKHTRNTKRLLRRCVCECWCIYISHMFMSHTHIYVCVTYKCSHVRRAHLCMRVCICVRAHVSMRVYTCGSHKKRLAHAHIVSYSEL